MILAKLTPQPGKHPIYEQMLVQVHDLCLSFIVRTLLHLLRFVVLGGQHVPYLQRLSQFMKCYEHSPLWEPWGLHYRCTGKVGRGS